MSEQEEWRYGYQSIAKRGRPITIKPVGFDGQRCETCRNLTVRNERCVCTRGHALEATGCEDYADCSRERDFRPFFDYNLWLRR